MFIPVLFIRDKAIYYMRERERERERERAVERGTET